MKINPQYDCIVVGLGAMGAGMATRLLDEGFAVTVWNRSSPAREPFEGRSGAMVADSPAAAFHAPPPPRDVPRASRR